MWVRKAKTEVAKPRRECRRKRIGEIVRLRSNDTRWRTSDSVTIHKITTLEVVVWGRRRRWRLNPERGEKEVFDFSGTKKTQLFDLLPRWFISKTNKRNFYGWTWSLEVSLGPLGAVGTWDGLEVITGGAAAKKNCPLVRLGRFFVPKARYFGSKFLGQKIN